METQRENMMKSLFKMAKCVLKPLKKIYKFMCESDATDKVREETQGLIFSTSRKDVGQ